MKRLCLISCLFGACLFAKEDEQVFVTPNISQAKNVYFAVAKSVASDINVTQWVANIQEGLQEGESGEIVAESNLHLLFTSKSCSVAEAKQKIHDVLANIQNSQDEELITQALMQLTDVYRATFVMSENGLTLVEDRDSLKTGDLIWRKHPDSVEKCQYYSEKDLLIAMRLNGLYCNEIKRPCFYGNVKYRQYLKENENANLGEAYIHSNPFTIFTFVKKSEIHL